MGMLKDIAYLQQGDKIVNRRLDAPACRFEHIFHFFDCGIALLPFGTAWGQLAVSSLADVSALKMSMSTSQLHLQVRGYLHAYLTNLSARPGLMDVLMSVLGNRSSGAARSLMLSGLDAADTAVELKPLAVDRFLPRTWRTGTT